MPKTARAVPRRATGTERISTEDRVMIDFARRWVPFGGPRAGDILVEYGLTPAVFAERVTRLLTAPRHLGLSTAETDALRVMVAGIARP